MIYVDMDGVLAKWNLNASLEDTYKKGYFLAREPEPNIIDAVKRLSMVGYDVSILSSAYSVRACWEKQQWLQSKGLGFLPTLFVPYGDKKADYVDEDNAILIDDFGKNLLEWNGIPVKFYNGINGHGGTKYEFSIRYDQDSEYIFDTLNYICSTAV